MRTTDEAELGRCVLVFPHYGVIRLDSLELGIIDDILACALGDEGSIIRLQKLQYFYHIQEDLSLYKFQKVRLLKIVFSLIC